jgi:hypothetical protein
MTNKAIDDAQTQARICAGRKNYFEGCMLPNMKPVWRGETLTLEGDFTIADLQAFIQIRAMQGAS